MTQCEIILKAMFENKDKEIWTAKDFQSGEYFVGYEASARMSELSKLHPEIFIVGRENRFRTLKINWDAPKTKTLIKALKVLNVLEGDYQ